MNAAIVEAWLNADASTKWVYNQDNEILGRIGTGEPAWTDIMVTGEVAPGPNSNKWYQSVAELRGVSVPVNTNDGTFSFTDEAGVRP